ncbi:uncharacterized protein [Dermacentor albipictus]|uniref:uncharacterized protein n=1 Tax=Dermacentor albipictus TaxID=60249 RepID=UPI0031FCA236
MQRELQPETETERAPAQQGATFELGDDGTRLASQEKERQGQRRVGAQNASPPVCGRSIEEANCTSLPFRLDATSFFFARRQLATMRPAPVLTDASANFPSALALAVGGGNEQAASPSSKATSAAFLELSGTGESASRYQAEDAFVLPDKDPSGWVTVNHQCVEDSSKHSSTDDSASRYRDEEVIPNLPVEDPTASVVARDDFAIKVIERDLLNEGSVSELDSNPNIQPRCLVSEVRSISSAATRDPKVQTMNTLGRLERHFELLEGIPVGLLKSLDSGREGNTIAGKCAVAHSSGTRVSSANTQVSEYSCEGALSRAHNKGFLKPESKNARVVRLFDLRGTLAMIKIARSNVAEEVLVLSGVTARWNGDSMFDFDSTPKARDVFTLAGLPPQSMEPPQWVDVSRDVARGMVVSMGDKGVTTGPTNALFEKELIPLFPEGEYQDDFGQLLDLVQASSCNGETGNQELPHLLPLEFPRIGYHAAADLAFRAPGGIRGCHQPPVLAAPLQRMKTLGAVSRCLLQIFDYPKSSSPNVLNNEATVATSHPTGELTPLHVERNCFGLNPDATVPDGDKFMESDDEAGGRSSCEGVCEVPTSAPTVPTKRTEITKNATNFATDNTVIPSGEAAFAPPEVALPRVDSGNEHFNMNFNDPEGARCDTSSSPAVALSRMNNTSALASAGPCSECYDLKAGNHVSSANAQMKTEDSSRVEEGEETLALSQSGGESHSSGPVFRTQNSDKSESVPCTQCHLSDVEDQERSFYEDGDATPDVLHSTTHDKTGLPEPAGGFEHTDEQRGHYYGLAPPTNAEIEELRNQIRLLVQNHALRASTPPVRADRRTGSASSCSPTTDEESFEEDSEDDDSSRTLYTTSESELSEYEDDLLSCYSGCSDGSSSSGASCASDPLDGLTEYSRREMAHAEDAESKDGLFTPTDSAASSLCRKRKRNFPPSSESPTEDPLAEIKKPRFFQLQSVGRPNLRTEGESDDFRIARNVTVEAEDTSSAIASVDNGTFHRAVLSLHSYCKYSPNRQSSFRPEEGPDERSPNCSSDDDDAMEEPSVEPAANVGCIEPRTHDGSPSTGAPSEAVAKLVDYPQLTPPEEEGSGVNTTPGQYLREDTQGRPLADERGNSGTPRNRSEAEAGAYKKVMEVYFDENSRHFLVLPASQECLIFENSENIPPEEDSKTKSASPGRISCEPQVELCKIQALNEEEASCKSVASGVASTPDEKRKNPTEAEREGPRRKIRRIGLPKGYKGRALHPNWRSNVDQ